MYRQCSANVPGMMRKGKDDVSYRNSRQEDRMTQVFDDRGDVHPVTVLKAGPCVITQLKTLAKDGYDAAQIGYVDFVKASKDNKARTGHSAKSNVPPVKMIKEVAIEPAKPGEGEEAVAVKAGDRVLVDIFSDEKFVD